MNARVDEEEEEEGRWHTQPQAPSRAEMPVYRIMGPYALPYAPAAAARPPPTTSTTPLSPPPLLLLPIICP